MLRNVESVYGVSKLASRSSNAKGANKDTAISTNIPKPEKIILDNGLKIISQHMPYASSSALNIAVKVGSVNESDDVSGISHFIEHMMFKGTKTRSALDIAKQSENAGVELNAFTDKEITNYHGKMLNENLPVIVDLILDMLFNSKIDKKELELERQVILEEIKMYEDSPQELAMEEALSSVWSEHPMGRPVIGTNKTVSGISRNSIVTYLDKFYKPDNMAISIAGNCSNLDKIIKQVRKFTSNIGGESIKQKMSPLYFKSGVAIKKKDIEQAHLVLLMKGLAMTDENRYALSVLNDALGGGSSSRLFQEIREKRGLVYTVNSFSDTNSLGGVFGIYAGFSSKHLKSILKIAKEELSAVKKDGLNPDELARAKTKARTSLLFKLESSAKNSMQNIYQDLFHERFIAPDEINEKVQSVTNDKIIELANKLFDLENCSVTVVGPKKGLPKKIELSD